MNGRERNVGRISCGAGRYQACGEDDPGECLDLLCGGQDRECGDCFQPKTGCLSISLGRFAKHFRGNEQVKILPAVLPPIPRGLLVRGND